MDNILDTSCVRRLTPQRRSLKLTPEKFTYLERGTGTRARHSALCGTGYGNAGRNDAAYTRDKQEVSGSKRLTISSVMLSAIGRYMPVKLTMMSVIPSFVALAILESNLITSEF